MNAINKIISIFLLLPVLLLNVSGAFLAKCSMDMKPSGSSCCAMAAPIGANYSIARDNCCCSVGHAPKAEDNGTNATLSDQSRSKNLIEYLKLLPQWQIELSVVKFTPANFLEILTHPPKTPAKIYTLNASLLI